MNSLKRKRKGLGLQVLLLIVVVSLYALLHNYSVEKKTTNEAPKSASEKKPEAPKQSEPAADTNTTPTLRELAQGHNLLIGTSVGSSPFLKDEEYKKVLAQEFNVFTIENDLKFSRVHPQRDVYNFLIPDVMVKFAGEHRMKVRGHTLVWYRNLPDWISNGDFSKQQLKAILKDHIQTVVKRYKGRIYAWDVVNEAYNTDGTLRENIFLKVIGPEYIELAFKWAHEADPNALLFYNDYGNEGINSKSTAIYKMAKNLKKKGIPIDGIGFQMHTDINKKQNYNKVKENFKRLADIGVGVQITEMDVKTFNSDLSDIDKVVKQAEVYQKTLNVCLKAENCSAFVTWGFTDRYTPINEKNDVNDFPLLFTSDYKKKLSYKALREALLSE